MIAGLGIDLVENRRLRRELERGKWRPEDGIFTSEEISYCSRGKKPALRYAACFAAKEATHKALGLRINDLGNFREAEVRFEKAAECGIQLHGRLKMESERLGIRQITLSIARHTSETIAIVIVEK